MQPTVSITEDWVDGFVAEAERLGVPEEKRASLLKIALSLPLFGAQHPDFLSGLAEATGEVEKEAKVIPTPPVYMKRLGRPDQQVGRLAARPGIPAATTAAKAAKSVPAATRAVPAAAKAMSRGSRLLRGGLKGGLGLAGLAALYGLTRDNTPKFHSPYAGLYNDIDAARYDRLRSDSNERSISRALGQPQ